MLGPLGLTDTATSTDNGQSDGDKKKKDDDEADDGVQVWLGLINAGPINLDEQIEEPVTSGSDIDLNIGDAPDEAH